MGFLTYAPVVWDDLIPTVAASGPGAAGPTFSAYNGTLRAYEYVGVGPTAKDFHFAYQLPHAWKEGSIVSPHLHLYVPDLAIGGTIRFFVDYTWTNIGQTGAVVVQTIFGDLVRADNAGIANNAVLEFPDIDGTGKTISSMIMTRLYRDPAALADTFAASVWLKAFDIHYQRDTNGSNSEDTKW